MVYLLQNIISDLFYIIKWQIKPGNILWTFHEIQSKLIQSMSINQIIVWQSYYITVVSIWKVIFVNDNLMKIFLLPSRGRSSLFSKTLSWISWRQTWQTWNIPEGIVQWRAIFSLENGIHGSEDIHTSAICDSLGTNVLSRLVSSSRGWRWCEVWLVLWHYILTSTHL